MGEWPGAALRELVREMLGEPVELLVERRQRERRRGGERRDTGALNTGGGDDEHRLIVSEAGGRLVERRAPLVPVEIDGLDSMPRPARRKLKAVRFVERIEPPAWQRRAIAQTYLALDAQSGNAHAHRSVLVDLIVEYERWFQFAVGDEHLAEDLTQETVMRVAKALPSFQFRAGLWFSAWVEKVARNVLTSHRERSNRLDTELVEPAAFQIGEHADRLVAEPAPDPDDVFFWISDEDLASLVEQLPERQRRTLVLRYRFGMKGSPPRTAWTPGKASTDCETQPGGSLTRLVNARISDTQVWLDAWQSSSKVQLCIRAAGDSAAGGRLTVDVTGSPGVVPILTQGPDTDVCTTDVFIDNQDELYIRRSPTGPNPPTSANPVSVCVTKGTTSQRFTVGFTGSPTLTLPSWTPDS